MERLPDELLKRILDGEGLEVEFKKATRDVPSTVYDTVCSFSNREGGHIFLGVKDSGEIVGVDKSCASRIKKDFVNSINNPNKISPPLYLTLEEYDYDGKIVLHVYVPKGTTVYRHAGRLFDRNNEADVDITDNANLVFELYARKQESFFVNKVYPVFSVPDLRRDLIDRARKLTPSGHPWRSMTDEEMLRSARLMLIDRQTGKEGITLASILLFGSDQLIYSVLPQHKTDALLRVYDMDRYDDRDVIETNLIDSYDRLMAFGRKHLNDLFVLDGIRRVSARDAILREIVANLLSHRDFNSRYTPSLVIERDKLIAKNGAVAHGFGFLKLESFKPFAKNPVIANVFRNIGWADELGSGMRNAFKFSKLYGGGEPTFEEGEIFVATIPLIKSAIETKMGPTRNTKDAAFKKLVDFCSEPRSRKEMMAFLNLTNVDYFTKNYIVPLLESGKLMRTIPEKPASPNQQYVKGS